MKGTLRTPTAITSWKASPTATVFQLIALRLLLNKKAISIRDTIPSTPRPKLSREKPCEGITSVMACVASCANAVNELNNTSRVSSNLRI